MASESTRGGNGDGSILGILCLRSVDDGFRYGGDCKGLGLGSTRLVGECPSSLVWNRKIIDGKVGIGLLWDEGISIGLNDGNEEGDILTDTIHRKPDDGKVVL